jgi:hypothetical protein
MIPIVQEAVWVPEAVFWRREKSFVLPEIEPCFIGRVTCSLVIMAHISGSETDA